MALFTDHSGERTEMPTPLRLEEARRRGQVPRSGEVVSAAVLAACVVALAAWGPGLAEALRQMVAGSLAAAGQTSGATVGGMKLAPVIWAALPIVALPLLAAMAANLLQFGPLFTAEPLRPQAKRISPATGVKRIFSGRTATRLVLDLVKIAAVTGVSWLVIAAALRPIATMATGEAGEILRQAGTLTLGLAIRIVAVLALVAVVDLIYQRWRHIKDLKITRREMLDDLRRMEGSPQTARRVRRAARELSAQRNTGELSQATIVIAGRFGPAVALRYTDEMPAPKVLAVGSGSLAARVRRAASDQGLPVVVDRKLAAALARACRAGQDIPESLYDDVAVAVASAAPRPADRAEDTE